MGLLERVTTLLRANLYDLIDRAEEPEELLKQLILDMQNQLLQVKTQLAMAVAEQNLRAHRHDGPGYLRTAELALEMGREDPARHAAEQSLHAAQLADRYAQQLEDQRLQVENLKTALFKLESKLRHAQTYSGLLMTQHPRAPDRAAGAASTFNTGATPLIFDGMEVKSERVEANAETEDADRLHEELVADRKQERIDRILHEIRRRKGAA